MLRYIPFLLLFLLLGNTCTKVENFSDEIALEIPKMRGVNFVAPPRPFSSDPMPSIQGINADWIAVIPYGYSRLGEPSVYYNVEWQWWGEKTEGAKETIERAKAANFKVLLKPQIYIGGGWVGDMDFTKEEDWLTWERDYETFIIEWAHLAAEQQVAALCIGTEYDIAAQKRENYWRGLISRIKEIYNGPLVYASNWDTYHKIPFWDELDYVGVDAYFPLLRNETPEVSQLKKAWKPYVEDLEKFYRKVKKPIVFTEYGYLSVDGCAYNTWELEGMLNTLDVNENAQANAFEALFQVFWDKPWWGGGFVWKWYPNLRPESMRRAKDYTPQQKVGENILREWYGK